MKSKILIADDVASVRREIEEYLILEKFDVIHAETGSQALEILDASFSAVILDIKMATATDGMDALSKITKRTDLRGLSVIMLTGVGRIDQAVAALKTGADDFLTKPVSCPLLVAALRTGIARRQASVLRSAVLGGATPDHVVDVAGQIIASAIPGATIHILRYSNPVEKEPAPAEPRPLYTQSILSSSARCLGSIEVNAEPPENKAACDELIRYLADLIGIAIELNYRDLRIAKVQREKHEAAWAEIPGLLSAIKDRIVTPAQTIAIQLDQLAEEAQRIVPPESRGELARRMAIIRYSSTDIQEACGFLNRVEPAITPYKAPVNILRLIAGRIDDFNRSSVDFDIEPGFDQGSTLALICQVDAAEIGNCISSLLRNSRDAILEKRRSILHPGAGGGAEFILVRLIDRGKAGIEICVEDSGIGISEEYQSKIFKPLFTTKRRVDSHGYELFHARRIAEAHGGKIEFTSTYGEGAKFTLWLPGCIQNGSVPNGGAHSWRDDTH